MQTSRSHDLNEIVVTSDTHKLAKRTVISNSPALVHEMAGILYIYIFFYCNLNYVWKMNPVVLCQDSALLINIGKLNIQNHQKLAAMINYLI